MTKSLVILFRGIQISEAARSSLACHKPDKNKLRFLSISYSFLLNSANCLDKEHGRKNDKEYKFAPTWLMPEYQSSKCWTDREQRESWPERGIPKNLFTLVIGFLGFFFEMNCLNLDWDCIVWKILAKTNQANENQNKMERKEQAFIESQ